MSLKNVPSWQFVCVGLAVLIIFFLFAMKGYDYIAYTLAFIVFLIIVFHIGSTPLKRIVAVLTCIGLVYFCIVEVFICSNCRTDKDSQRGYIITLGAAVHGSVPSLALTHRIQATYDYLIKYPDSIAVVSGGQGSGEDISEAQCMYDWLTERGIAPERIIIEDKSTSTIENLKFSLQLIKENGGSADDIAIVSSPYHLYRAKTMAKSLGIDAAGVACVFGYPIFTLGMFIREAFGVTHLWILGN